MVQFWYTEYLYFIFNSSPKCLHYLKLSSFELSLFT